MSYQSFVARKLSSVPSTGLTGNEALPPGLFPHQIDLTRWASALGVHVRTIDAVRSYQNWRHVR